MSLAANPPITDTYALAADQSQSLSVIGTRTRRAPYRRLGAQAVAWGSDEECAQITALCMAWTGSGDLLWYRG